MGCLRPEYIPQCAYLSQLLLGYRIPHPDAISSWGF
jgi:hypothetical protein